MLSQLLPQLKAAVIINTLFFEIASFSLPKLEYIVLCCLRIKGEIGKGRPLRYKDGAAAEIKAACCHKSHIGQTFFCESLTFVITYVNRLFF